jgi:hypothetical protein
MNLREAIEHFKQLESPEQITPMLTDPKLNDLISAWGAVVCDYEKDKKVGNVGWMELWGHVELYKGTIGSYAGIPLSDVGHTINKAIGHQLIYPDGTVNKYASQYLRSVILDKLPKK